DLPPPGVLHDVACDLGDRRGHDGEVTSGKANVRRELTSSPSGGQDVVLGVDLKAVLILHRSVPSSGSGSPALPPGPGRWRRHRGGGRVGPWRRRPPAGGRR